MDINSNLNLVLADILFISLKKIYKDVIFCNKYINEDTFVLEVKLHEKSENVISINDFKKIEKEMQKIISGAHKLEYEQKTISELEKIFSDNKYVLHYLKNVDAKKLELVSICNELFIHDNKEIKNTNQIKGFGLLSIGGAYWLSNANNEQLIQIKGVGFDKKEDFEKYMIEYDEKIKNDHRTIAKKLDLFTFDLLAGQGLPFWLANGAIIRREIRNFLNSLEFKYGFDAVYTPILGNIELYKISGHWDHYKENMFSTVKIDDEELVLRPMTCPHHILIFKKKNYSYRQLPIRLCEESMLHRYEASGGLSGFERVREMTLEDTHIFCTPEQIMDEVLNCYNIIKDAYEGLGCEAFEIDLALHDPNNKEKFHHDEQMWNKSENDLRKILRDNNIPFVEKVGDAAFYGPKIDFQVKTSLGRIVTMSTIQLDFLLPKKFELTYKDSNNEQKQVIMIHLGIIGTYERLLSIILEQTKGLLPLWLSPKQIVVIPVGGDQSFAYARKIHEILRISQIRSYLDNRDERLNKKIRDAQIDKIPYQIVVGEDEVKGNYITVRRYGEDMDKHCKLEDFITLVKARINNHR